MTGAAVSRVDAVLFDKDGTLFDFAATWEVWACNFLRRLALGDETRATEFGALIGFDFARRAFRRDSLVIAGTPVDIAQALQPACPDLPTPELISILNEEAARAPMAEAVPLAPLLDAMRGRGLRLGVATNDAEAPARAHLAAAGIGDRFDFVAGSDSGHGSKPEPGPLLAFCQAVGTTPARTLMVGDSTHDLRAGRAAGMPTAAVLTGLAHAEELAPFADVVLPDIGHLPGWIWPR